MPQADERTDPTEIAIAERLPLATPDAVERLADAARVALPGYPSSRQVSWATSGHGDPDGRG